MQLDGSPELPVNTVVTVVQFVLSDDCSMANVEVLEVLFDFTVKDNWFGTPVKFTLVDCEEASNFPPFDPEQANEEL